MTDFDIGYGQGGGESPNFVENSGEEGKEKNINFRKWIGNILLAIIALMLIALVLKIYTDNRLLANDVAQLKLQVDFTTEQVNMVKEDNSALATTVGEQDEIIREKEVALREASTTVASLGKVYEQCQRMLRSYTEMTAVLIGKIATIMTGGDLARIPVADVNLSVGQDTDHDGLSDMLEKAFGTDVTKSDSDGDGYSDSIEIVNGFDPLSSARMPLDAEFAKSQAGKIIVQIDSGDEAWYVNPLDHQRYYLGTVSK